jgi:hypothetical protein
MPKRCNQRTKTERSKCAAYREGHGAKAAQLHHMYKSNSDGIIYEQTELKDEPELVWPGSQTV